MPPLENHEVKGDLSMMIEERKVKPAVKELKVNIPVRYHLQLHTLKVIEGRQIHGVVQEALENYFESLKAPVAMEVDAPKTGYRIR